MRKVKSRQAGTWEWLNFERNHITLTDALLDGIVLCVLHFTLGLLILIVLLLLRRIDSILRRG